MSLPSIEPLPDENVSLPPARRRRLRRTIIPPGSGERADFLYELSQRTVPSFDFFLFSLLAGLCLGAAFLLDAPALVFLAALLAPFMAPVIGVSLGTLTGTLRFTLQSLGSLSIGSLIVFLSGTLAGWVANLLPQHVYQQAAFHSHFTWPDFIVLTLGAGLTAYLIARSPNQRPLVTSVAVAYGLYLPVGAAGFGMTSGIAGLWPDGLGLFFTHLIWAALVGMLALGLLGLRPLNASGYAIGAAYILAAVTAIVLIYNPQPTLPAPLNPPAGNVIAGKETQRPTQALSLAGSPTSIQPTFTTTVQPTATRTRTLIPTKTATQTITPVPTPVWAKISTSEGNGALIREKPSYEATVVQSLLNGSLVEVLPEVVEAGGVNWVHVRATSGKEGWIVRSLLRTATPAPSW